MRANALALLVALAAAPLALPTSSAIDPPDVEVRPCEPPTWGPAVYINGHQATTCFIGPSAAAEPDVRVERCEPPTFGYAVWVNGEQVVWCATEA